MSAFNLLDSPWIAVTGKNERQSLRDVFSDPSIQRLAGNPVDKIVVLRLLMSITHAAVPVPDTGAWQKLTPAAISAAVLPYLDRWRDRFDLAGEHPFLQFPQLRGHEDKIAPPSALQINVSSGNKPVLSHWNLPDDVTNPEEIMLLLRGTCFGCGGKKYDNSIVLTPGYPGKSNEKGKPSSGTAGTLLGYQGYLHSYLLGDSLLDTVRLNLLTEEEISGLGAFPGGLGRPFWEDMPAGEDCPRARAYRASYQGELFPLDKFLLIEKDSFLMTDGIAYPNHKSGLIDPALTFFPVKNNVTVVWANPEKRPWRELPALLSFLESLDGRTMPYTISHGLRKIPPSETTIRLWTGGLRVSSNAGEQFPSGHNDYVESTFFFPRGNLGTGGLAIFKAMMEKADAYSRILYASIAGFYKDLSDLTGPDLAAKYSTVFWEQMEPDAQHICDVAFAEPSPSEDVLKTEYTKWRGIVKNLYGRACPRETARQLTAWSDHEPDFRPPKEKSKSKKSNKKG